MVEHSSSSYIGVTTDRSGFSMYVPIYIADCPLSHEAIRQQLFSSPIYTTVLYVCNTSMVCGA